MRPSNSWAAWMIAPSTGRRLPAAAVSLPAHGVGAQEALALFTQAFSAGLTASAGPRYFGFVTGGSTPAALMGDWLTSAYDQNASDRTSRAAAQIEEGAVGMLRGLLGLPEAFARPFRDRRDDEQLRRAGDCAAVVGQAARRGHRGGRPGRAAPAGRLERHAAFVHLQSPRHAGAGARQLAAGRHAARARGRGRRRAAGGAAAAGRAALHRRCERRRGEHGGFRRPRGHRGPQAGVRLLPARGRGVRRVCGVLASLQAPRRRLGSGGFDRGGRPQVAQRAVRQRGPVHAPSRPPGGGLSECCGGLPGRAQLGRCLAPDPRELAAPACPAGLAEPGGLRCGRLPGDRRGELCVRRAARRADRGLVAVPAAGARAHERRPVHAPAAESFRRAGQGLPGSPPRQRQGLFDRHGFTGHAGDARRVQQLAHDAERCRDRLAGDVGRGRMGSAGRSGDDSCHRTSSPTEKVPT